MFPYKLAESNDVWRIIRGFAGLSDIEIMSPVMMELSALRATITTDKQVKELDASEAQRLWMALSTNFVLPPMEVTTQVAVELRPFRAPVMTINLHPVLREVTKNAPNPYSMPPRGM